jgi:hypothetical protein
VTFFEVSAVENENISEAIEVLASQIYEVYSYEKLRKISIFWWTHEPEGTSNRRLKWWSQIEEKEVRMLHIKRKARI